jgi:polyisoprenyl-teichoic acid--peptidoglycan teichoic acid transferase
MRNRHLFFILLVCILLAVVAAFTLAEAGPPPPASAMLPTLTPARYQPGLDATPTATPFQPVPDEFKLISAPSSGTPAAPLGPTLTPSVPPPPAQTAVAMEPPPRQTNILVLGSDQRPNTPGIRTDTIILVTLNAEQGKVNLTSFPRDLYVHIPGWGMQRINTAYQLGGADLLASTMQYNFGVPVDHSVMINLSSFREVIDSLGGVDVRVGQEFSDKNYHKEYVTLQPGIHHMDGITAEWYVRSRKTTSDFDRGRRQQEVLQAIFEKLVSLNAVRRAPEFFELYNKNVSTDLGLGDLLPFLPLAAQVSDTSRIHHYYIGPNQVYDYLTPEGAMVLVPLHYAVMEVLSEALNMR